MAYSVDGINWVLVGTSIFTLANGISCNENRFVAVGQGTNNISYSYDGIYWNWSNPSASIFSDQGIGVTWNGTRFVAVGSGTHSIAYSSNGITWT